MKQMSTNKMKLRFITFFIFCFFIFTISAQRSVGSWKEYRAYQDAFIVAETANKVFAVYDGGVIDAGDKKRYGSLLSFSPDDQSIKLYEKKDGLNDVGISYMAYSKDAAALVLVYGQNSNIDILTGNGFTNIASLKNNINFQDRTVNNLEIDGSLAYLSTAFGIVVIDLKKLEIKSTYNLEKETRSISRFGQYLYVATSDGVFRGLTTSNLSDKKNWESYSIVSAEEDKKIEKLLVFNDLIVHYRPNIGVFYQGSDGQNHLIQNGAFSQLSVNQNQLVLTSKGGGYISFLSDFSSRDYTISIHAHGVSSIKDKGIYWIAADSVGLMGIKREPTSIDYTIATSGVKINSPRRDLTYYLTYSQNKLLVTGGSNGSAADRSNYPGTLMVYENNSWFNFDNREIEAKTGIQCRDFTSVAVDPLNPNHYFVSSWGEGLYEFLNNQFVTRYSYDTGNSTLQSPYPDSPGAMYLVRIDGLTYDKENNLYMTNSEVRNCINIYSSNKEWSSLFYEPLSRVRYISQQVLIDSKNRKWVNLPRGDNTGIFVFDDKNSTSYEYFSRSFIDQQGNNVQATGYLCMAEDLNGTIWVGTDNGPISFSSPSQVEQSRCNRVVVSGDASNPYYLLYGEKITAIAIDGGNRKWFGTAGNGIFCVDINGNDVQVTNFTTENSFLISDVINSIAINNNTGEVFVATDRGLVSYMGNAITGKVDYSNVYAYPNPVRPATDDIVVITGLMANSTVKITDLNGNLIIQGSSAGGQFIWNCTNRSGQKVVSGIYLVLASTPDGKQGVAAKIMVIK